MERIEPEPARLNPKRAYTISKKGVVIICKVITLQIGRIQSQTASFRNVKNDGVELPIYWQEG